jgi:DNA-directed RNA polymerase specialized sigma24 family protein
LTKAGLLFAMRFFGGLSVDEIAQFSGVAPRTVDRQWRAARAWLSRELSLNQHTIL